MTDFFNLRRVDAHCHANFPAYGGDSVGVVKRALTDGTGMICVGTEFGTSLSAVQVAALYDGVWAAVGYHPSHISDPYHDVDELGESDALAFDVAKFRQLIQDNPKKIVAIGECGLDRHHLPVEADVINESQQQEKIFRQQIDLALEFDLPVIVHCRDLHQEVFVILADYQNQGKHVKGVAHCFTGTKAEAEKYLEFGFYVSFAGMVTYKPRASERESGETLQEVAKIIPRERLLAETDAPWLLPMPYRGKKVDGEIMKNEPLFVRETIKFLAEVRGEDLETFEKQLLVNTQKCFRLE